ncbi:MAG: hypothetical protein CMC08_03895 [Flavobacteriaceae bacterium]|nr:hypothetical protein [Flavobacteriaceae bacterium]
MSLKKITAWDRKVFRKLINFQLPNYAKKIGAIIAILSISALFILKGIDSDSIWTRYIVRNLFVMGLLAISLSRERIEDEMIKSIRSQSYAIAFIVGVLYAIVQPYVTFGVSYLINRENALLELNHWQLVTFMLLIQVMFFHALLKRCRI